MKFRKMLLPLFASIFISLLTACAPAGDQDTDVTTCLNTAINVTRYTVNPQSTFIAGLYVRPAVQRQIGHLSVLTFTALGLNWH